MTKFQIKINKKENQANIEKDVKYLNSKNDEKIESNKISEYVYNKGMKTMKEKLSEREKGNINKEKKSYFNKLNSDNKNGYINNKIGIDKEYKEKKEIIDEESNKDEIKEYKEKEELKKMNEKNY